MTLMICLDAPLRQYSILAIRGADTEVIISWISFAHGEANGSE
jgi:hypothetical protein